jgi:hypothetical protein
LPGGTEDNDLWFYVARDTRDNNLICTVWEPTKKERARIASGENIRLDIWVSDRNIPPMGMEVTDEPIGKKHD